MLLIFSYYFNRWQKIKDTAREWLRNNSIYIAWQENCFTNNSLFHYGGYFIMYTCMDSCIFLATAAYSRWYSPHCASYWHLVVAYCYDRNSADSRLIVSPPCGSYIVPHFRIFHSRSWLCTLFYRLWVIYSRCDTIFIYVDQALNGYSMAYSWTNYMALLIFTLMLPFFVVHRLKEALFTIMRNLKWRYKN